MKLGLFEDLISKGQLTARAKALAMVPTIQKLDHLKYGHICLYFKWFKQNGEHLYRFQMIGLLDFRTHSKPGPFEKQTSF